eukprot:147845-Rhodomonas_salina.1
MSTKIGTRCGINSNNPHPLYTRISAIECNNPHSPCRFKSQRKVVAEHRTLGFGVQGSGFRVQGSGSRVQGTGSYRVVQLCTDAEYGGTRAQRSPTTLLSQTRAEI